MKDMQRFSKLYRWTITAVGALVCAYAAMRLSPAGLDLRFIVLAVCTLGFGSRLTVRIPRVDGEVSVSDTFIFITLLLYGGEAAVLLAAAEALLSSTRFSQMKVTIFFNGAVMAVSTFLAARTIEFYFGTVTDLRLGEYSARYLKALIVMALVHYAVNSGLVAVAEAIKTGKSIWQTWRTSYLWTSLTYFAGASTAGIIARLIDAIGFYGVLGVLPIIATIYLTYRTYLCNIEASQERAEQAQRHVEELSRYIAEQERMREQFTQMEKLSALGELASGVAHNFNNTLAAILARAELMLTQTADPKLRRGLEIIVKSSGDGAKTVRRIQDFARQRRDHDFQLVSVDQLLSDVSEITRPRWKDAAEVENVHINLRLHADSRTLIHGDAAELRDVFINMIFNAVDAMPHGGDLTLAAEEQDGWVVVSVSDTGTGMSADVRAKVFNPFFTTKGMSGMGLGLAVSYGVITRHGGSIVVESEVGRGTTFRIRLPTAGHAGGGLDKEEAAKVDRPRRIKMAKILVVDDEEPVRQLLCEILEDAGCETVQASGGREAVAHFDAGHFDAVFTDIGMPGMSGWELARLLRERDPQIPLAVITGWGETVSSSQKEEARVDWLLSKPFSLAQIMQLGQEIVERRKAAHAVRETATEADPCAVICLA
jgi:signal transduction histidine kinase/CheY-like chemotaxis protein